MSYFIHSLIYHTSKGRLKSGLLKSLNSLDTKARRMLAKSFSSFENSQQKMPLLLAPIIKEFLSSSLLFLFALYMYPYTGPFKFASLSLGGEGGQEEVGRVGWVKEEWDDIFLLKSTISINLSKI